jgi:hypothetical protein
MDHPGDRYVRSGAFAASLAATPGFTAVPRFTIPGGRPIPGTERTATEASDDT